MASDKDHLTTLLTALDAAPGALKRPVCRGWIGDWQISGKHGHALADGAGFLLYATTPEHDRLDPDGKTRCYGSARRWTNIKHHLAFARLTQEGDDEGMFHLDHLPTRDEAETIRECLGIRKRRNLSDDARTRLAQAMSRINRSSSA
jgi:hypothetical protein